MPDNFLLHLMLDDLSLTLIVGLNSEHIEPSNYLLKTSNFGQVSNQLKKSCALRLDLGQRSRCNLQV